MAKTEKLKIEDDGRYYGVVGKNNKVIVPFEYDEIIRTFSSGLINVCKNDKWGCLDLEGNTVIPLIYDWIYPFGIGPNCVTQVKLNGKWGLIDKLGNVVVPITQEKEIVLKGKASKFVGINGNSIIVNSNGTIVADDSFETNSPIGNQEVAISQKGNLFGLIDKNGNTILGFEYNKILFSKSKKCFVLEKNGLYGIASLNGKLISNTVYDHIGPGEWMAFVAKKHLFYGVINCDGEIIIPFEYSRIIYSNSKRCFVVEKNGLFGIASLNGKLITDLIYEYVGSGDWKAFVVKKQNSYGAINSDGKIVIPFEYDEIKNLGERCFECSNKNEQIRLKVRDKGGVKIISIFQSEGFSIIEKTSKLFIVKSNDGRFGLVNKKEELLTDVDFEDAKIIQSKGGVNTCRVIAAKKNGFWGLFNLYGKNIAPHIYDTIGFFDGQRNLIEVFQGEHCGLLRGDGKGAIPCVFDPIKNKEGEKRAYRILSLDTSFRRNCVKLDGFTIPNVSSPTESSYITMKKDGYWGALDYRKMKEVIPFEYNQIDYADYKGCVLVKKGKKWGLLNDQFKEVIKIEFDWISIQLPIIKVKNDNKWGAFDLNLKPIIPIENESIKLIGDNKIQIVKNGQINWKFYRKDGYIIDLVQYSMIEDYYSQGVAMVKKNDKYGFINEDGVEVIPCIYDDAHPFKNGIAIVEYNEMWGALNNNGAIVIPFDYMLLADLSMVGPTLLMAVKDRKCGVIDKNNNIIVPFEYDGTLPMFGMITVIKNGKKGVFNHKGQLILPAEFDDIQHPFMHSTSINVCKNGKWGVYNQFGKEICEPRYDKIDDYGFACGRLAVCRNNKWGFINRKGREVIECIYDEVFQFFEENHCEVKLNGKKITISIYGERIG